MAEPTDTRLIEETLKGNTEAFGILVERYRDAVFGAVLSRIAGFSDAQDVAQETFIEAYRNLSSLREPAAFPGWLHTIACRQCSRWHRSCSSALPGEMPELECRADLIPQGPLRPDEALDRQELRDQVMATIRSLPSHLGEAITLYYIDGLSYEAIGRFLSVPPSTVKGRLQSGRKHLKERMLTMVEETLQHECPDRQFTDEVLRGIMERTRRAREDQAHEEVLEFCEQALEVLNRLEPSEDHTRARIDALRWRGHERLHWLGEAREAAASYGEAADLAAELDAPRTQVDNLLNRLAALFCTGEYQGLPDLATHVAKIYADIGDVRGETTSQAIADLARLLSVGWEPAQGAGRSTGYGVHRFTLKCMSDGIDLDDEERPLIGAVAAGRSPRRYATLLAQVGQPVRLLDARPQVGTSWQGEIRDRKYGQLLMATRTIETNDDTVVVPAGRFEGCLRVVTEVPEPPDADFSDTNKTYQRRTLCGRRTLWFAPGVGLVKYRHEKSWWGQSRVAELTAYSVPNAGTSEYLPLSTGSRWQYRQPDELYEVFVTESYRVIEATDSEVHLACATYSEPADAAALEVCFGEIFERETDAGDLRGEARSLASLANAKARQGDGEGAMQAFERMDEVLARIGDLVLTCDLLTRTEMDGSPPAFLLGRYERAVAIARQLGDRQREENILGMMEDMGFRRARFEVALDAAERRLSIARQHGYAKETTTTEAGIDLAGALLEDLEGSQAVLGGVRRCMCVSVDDNALVMEAIGGVVPMRSNRRPVPPIYDPEFWSTAPLLQLPVTPGSSWTEADAHGSWERTVEADDECIQTPAGEFEGCVRVRTRARLRPATDGALPSPRRRPKERDYLEGEKRMWFAPGAGIARAEYDHANGQRTAAVLVEYSCSEGGDGYYPLVVGNWWRYEWRDENGELLFRSKDRVVLQEDGRFYLACSGYTTSTDEYGV